MHMKNENGEKQTTICSPPVWSSRYLCFLLFQTFLNDVIYLLSTVFFISDRNDSQNFNKL